MQIKTFLFILLSITIFSSAFPNVSINVVDQIVSRYFADTEEDVFPEDVYNQLLDVLENPINLNTCTREDLESLFFLSAKQIEEFLYYRYSFGEIYTIYELQLVNGFDDETITFLLPFVYVGSYDYTSRLGLNLNNLFLNAKHQVLLRTDYTLQKKRGYIKEFNPQYLGSPFYNHIRYRFTSKYVSAGIAMEKDSGEPFDWKYNKGYDFYAPHLFLSSFWKFKSLAFGHYKANFGQGLVVQANSSFGKSSIFNNLKHAEGISKSTSLAEYGYFNGVAFTIDISKWSISAMFSNKNIDANIQLDDNQQSYISSIKTDGIHRTEADFTKKHVLEENLFGSNVQFRTKYAKFGATALTTLYDIPIMPEAKPYNMYYFSGKQQSNFSVDYRARFLGLQFAGETAITNNGYFAHLHGFNFQPSSLFGFTFIYRDYSPQYVSLYGKAFGQSSYIANEKGIYLGSEIFPIKRWKISAYADVFTFPWLKYLVHSPSNGYQSAIQAVYTPNRQTSVFFQYKLTQKMKNVSDEEFAINQTLPFVKNEYKIQVDVKPSKGLFLKTVIQGNEYAAKNCESSAGLLLFQDVGFEFDNFPITVFTRFAFFDALNYDNRLYAYERDVLYAFSVPMYYGQGNRTYLNVVYKPTPYLGVYLKVSNSYYVNKNEIGSGGETIVGKNKSDISLLLNWRF